MKLLLGDPVCVAPVGDRCGEGVLWHPTEKSVYWTDINRFLIHRFQPSAHSVQNWMFDEVVSAVLLTDHPHLLLVCLGSRVILWDPRSDTRQNLGFSLPGWPTVRLNDAAIGPDGRLWAGSMRNNVNPDGSESEAGGADGVLFRVSANGKSETIQREIGISNTLVWSPDQTTFYFGDSLANSIWHYAVDPMSHDIRQTGVHFSNFSRGVPDGSAIDTEGCIWNCRWDGACIVRVTPSGEVDRIIEMPTRNITNCTFGGEGMDVLYITTAASPNPGERLAGSLFSIQTNITGVTENRFSLAAL